MSILTPISPKGSTPVRFGRLAEKLSALAKGGSGLAKRASEEEATGTWLAKLRGKTEEAKREKDIRKIGALLDQMSDRQLAVLGFSRDFLFSDLEDRYDAMMKRQDQVAALTDEREEAPKRLTHAA